MAEIYLAGGCFWGTEHYFKNIDGVIATETGYANGSEDFMESLRRNQAPAPASGDSSVAGGSAATAAGGGKAAGGSEATAATATGGSSAAFTAPTSAASVNPAAPAAAAGTNPASPATPAPATGGDPAALSQAAGNVPATSAPVAGSEMTGATASCNPARGGAPVKGPTYEQVYTDTTGFAETVRVTYNPEVLPLGELLEDYFCAIDPLSLNRQGEDRGTRYRTGIYYVDIADIPVIEQVMAAQEELYGCPLAVESGPLTSFFPAEERHQDYLDKNPEGYCHLSLKMFRYPRVVKELRSLLEGETDWNARMSNTAALIKERFGFFWVGFYQVKPTGAAGDASGHSAEYDSGTSGSNAASEAAGQGSGEAAGAGAAPADTRHIGSELFLGPFQGPIACMRIKFGRGVCGTAWKERKTLVVPDVEAFPGHIACSSLSRSEIVVPIFNDGSADLLEGLAICPGGTTSHGTTTSHVGNTSPGTTTSPGGTTSHVGNSDGEVIGVLDIDSTELATFDQADALWLSRLVSVLTGRH